MVKYQDLQTINLSRSQEIMTAIQRVVESGWYVLGKEVTKFEDDYSRYIGSAYCIGVGNGLDALTLIYRAYIEMGIMNIGDEVIVPANTYIASILSLTENGLVPVLVEPRFDTLQIDDSKIEAAITQRTRSILIVHLYGRCAYTDKIGELCSRYHLKLVEDNAQAHGCCYCSPVNGIITRTGHLGDAAGHSFYPGKNLGALGDGGAVTTDDALLARTVRTLSNYGSSQKYFFQYKGKNSRLDEIQASILGVKLKYLDEDNLRRRNIADFYIRNIRHPKIYVPSLVQDVSNVYHIFPILCDRRDDLHDYLLNMGIETLIHYPVPPHQQQAFCEWKNMSFPVTEKIHQQELSLPISPLITEKEAEMIVASINAFPL